jgi:type IV secretory pathway TrbD component
MEIIATIISCASGFALMRAHKAPIDLIATSLVVDAALAPLTAVIAARRGRSPLRWVAAGFVLGMWALAYVLIVAPAATDDRVGPQNPSRPPTSDAAA